MSETIKVLLLAANPGAGEGAAGLRIDHEIRQVLESVRMGRAASELEISSELAVRAGDLVPAMLRHKPRIVHFAGHGDRDRGIVLDEGERVGARELTALFASFTDVRVVLLNACEMLSVAKALSGVVDYTVAMEAPIRDAAAVHFAGVFYAALAFGRPVRFAFDLARDSMTARFGGKHAIPHLLVRDGADERPLVQDVAPPETEEAQEIKVNDVKTEGDADLANRAGSARAGRQAVDLSKATVGGSLKITNNRR